MLPSGSTGDRGGPNGGGLPPVVREGPSLLRLRVTSSGLVRTRRADGSPAQWPGTWNRPCHTALVSRSGLGPATIRFPPEDGTPHCDVRNTKTAHRKVGRSL